VVGWKFKNQYSPSLCLDKKEDTIIWATVKEREELRVGVLIVNGDRSTLDALRASGERIE